MSVKLTEVERLTLLNQFKILSRITPEEDQDLVYSYYVDILQHGFEYDYGRIFDDSLMPCVPKENGEFVLNVMYMYRCIKESYDNLVANNATGQITATEIAFLGFDAKEPGGHLRYCQHLVVEDLYPEYKGRRLESHMSVLDAYARMLSRFDTINGNEQHNMSAEQLKYILHGELV